MNYEIKYEKYNLLHFGKSHKSGKGMELERIRNGMRMTENVYEKIREGKEFNKYIQT